MRLSVEVKAQIKQKAMIKKRIPASPKRAKQATYFSLGCSEGSDPSQNFQNFQNGTCLEKLQ